MFGRHFYTACLIIGTFAMVYAVRTFVGQQLDILRQYPNCFPPFTYIPMDERDSRSNAPTQRGYPALDEGLGVPLATCRTPSWYQ